MGLNAKDIQVHLLKMFRASAKSSYMFLQNHPLFSSVLLVFLILYIFLSYIYTFLVYMSPFLLCGAIFLRIFWSSEQTQLKYVKIQEKKEEQNKVEPKCEPKLPPSNMRHEILYKYPSQNATSRRKNFRDKKWDVYGGLEEKAKDLSEVFQNEYTKRNIEPFKKGESSLYYGLPGRKTQAHKRQSLRTEPSMVDIVECNDTEMEIEKMEDDEDEEDGKEDGNNAILWTENDQKNLMDLGNSEMERNRRLESLIARRRARKLLKLQVENGLIDKKSMTPSLMAPLVITRGNCDNDDLEMPGSAPSVMPRSPYDIPYEPFEEKPNLTNDGFLQEFTSGHHKNLSSQIKQEHHKDSFHGRKFSDRHAYSRFRRLPEKGNHDWLIDQLIYRENGIKEPKGDEEDEKCKTDIDDMKNEKLKTSHHDTKSLSESESSSIVSNISNVKTNKSVSQKPRPGPRFSKPHERLLNIPIPSTNITTNTINESMYDNVPSPIDKRQETMFLTDRRFCHTPTYSIASDLQVEVSEIGSLTSTVDENGESNNSPSDRDSVLYDGDIDRDVSSGSEDLWGASFHGRVITEEDNNINNEEEVNNTSKDIVSPISLRQIDEEDVADVSSYSSRDEGPEDTPTCCVVTTDHNIFGTYMKYSLGKFEMPQSSNSSYVTTPQNQLSNETHQANQQEWCHLSENLTNESQIINDNVNNSTITEQGNIENSTSSEDPDPNNSIVRQESIDEGSNESISSSPRSVLPDKTLAEELSSPTFNQQMDIGSQQSNNMEDMTQETLNEDELPHDTMPQNSQPLVDYITDESHNVDQEDTNHMENSIEETNILRNMNNEKICRMEQQDKLNNGGESSEDNSSHQISQEDTLESTKQINEMETKEDVDEGSRDLAGDKVSSRELVEEDKNETLASDDKINEELQLPQVDEPTVHNKETVEDHTED